jgi:hypothetical protein
MIWGVLQQRVYPTPIDTVDQLKQGLIEGGRSLTSVLWIAQLTNGVRACKHVLELAVLNLSTG